MTYSGAPYYAHDNDSIKAFFEELANTEYLLIKFRELIGKGTYSDTSLWDYGIVAKVLSVVRPYLGLFVVRYGNARIRLPDGNEYPLFREEDHPGPSRKLDRSLYRHLLDYFPRPFDKEFKREGWSKPFRYHDIAEREEFFELETVTVVDAKIHLDEFLKEKERRDAELKERQAQAQRLQAEQKQLREQQQREYEVLQRQSQEALDDVFGTK